jgi:hypothetical protein
MSLQVELAKLRTVIEQTLGPDGSITKKLDEIEVDLKDGSKVMDDHSLRIDRLEQKQATRSKVTWAMTTAWLGLFATWVWNQLVKK